MQFFKKLTVVLFACGSLLFAKASLAVTYVCMDTTLGTFCMEMLEEDAPGTVANFLNYVRDGDYNQTFIHRTVPSFVIQGGGYQLPPEAAEVPSNGEIPNEFKVPNTRGTVAMAKLADQPNSATSEWFINLTTNVDLDTSNGGYTVFAKIVSGLPVVDAIGNAQR
ncbi:MAG: peptidylprolyl isomerase, partial [Pseudomonadota bacterium]